MEEFIKDAIKASGSEMLLEAYDKELIKLKMPILILSHKYLER